MKTKIYNTKNETVGEVDLSDKIFAAKWNADLVHQVLSVIMANKRKVIAHAKTRAEVSGGGKKPWKQKHTGRARHGSIRSPIWKGGGVTFGPTKERNFSKKINKKMVHAALHSVLSQKLRDNELKILESLKLDQGKTKLVVQILKNLQSKSTLFIPSAENKMIYRAASNIPKTMTTSPASLSIHDLLKYKDIFIEKEALVDIK